MARKPIETTSPQDTEGTTPADMAAASLLVESVQVIEGIPRIYASMSMIMAALEDGLSKDKTAPAAAGGFRYRSVEQVYAALSPLLVLHGVIVVPRYSNRHEIERQTSNGKPIYFSTVDAEFDFISTYDGSKVTVSTIGEAMDTSDKSTNKAMAVAFKYAAFIAFCIPVDDENLNPEANPVGDIRPRGKAKAEEPPPSPPPLTEEEAKTNFREAESLLEACTSVDALKEAWTKIKWERIPKGWHLQLQKLQKDMLKELKSPPPSKTAEPTRTASPAFQSGDIDDDIPF